MTIKNGKDTTLDQSTGNLPQMDSTLLGWFRPIIFSRITKTTERGRVFESSVDFNFKGVWQPLNPRSITMKPEGQRSWAWFQLHSDSSLILKPDEVVVYLSVKYRVMAQTHYKEYGFIEYHLIEDYR